MNIHRSKLTALITNRGCPKMYPCSSLYDIGNVLMYAVKVYHIYLVSIYSIFGCMRLTFWAMFDQTELDVFQTSSSFPTKITQNTGEFLFAFYNISIILVAVNMLIAMMSNSFQDIEVSIISLFMAHSLRFNSLSHDRLEVREIDLISMEGVGN